MRLDFNPQNRDRYKRIMAQVYVSDGTWVEGAMLESGFVMVSVSEHADDRLPPMLSAERKACVAGHKT